jgi:hypothetical protein
MIFSATENQPLAIGEPRLTHPIRRALKIEAHPSWRKSLFIRKAGRFKGPTLKGRFSRQAADGFQAIFFPSFQRPKYTLTLDELSARTTRNEKRRSYAF